MAFRVKQLDNDIETMRDGNSVRVISFTCPKCDNRYIISVMDEKSKIIRDELEQARKEYSESYDENNPDSGRKERKLVDFKKRELMNYMQMLKRQYLKEKKRHGR